MEPYKRQIAGSFNDIQGMLCLGMASWLRLDLTTAEQYVRRALRVAKQHTGRHSYGTRFAEAMLGELLFERGDTVAAERLTDEGYELPAEAGIVDFKLARFVLGAELKQLAGDRAAAIRRLNEGARIARALSLPRLRIQVEYTRLRLGLPPHPQYGPLPVTDYAQRRTPVDLIDEFTVLYEELMAIRLLLAAGETELAGRWVREWVDRLEQLDRPRELLKARRLLVACLAAADRVDEAKTLLAMIAAQCAEVGTVRYLVDGGPQVRALLVQLREDQRSGAWRPEWQPVPADFLTRLVEFPAVHTI
jgi:serine/threonine-protein kinase PknK